MALPPGSKFDFDQHLKSSMKTTITILALALLIIVFAAGALLLRNGGERSLTSITRSTGGQLDSSTSTVTTGPQPAAEFEGTTTLLLPKGYRQWVFVGSSLGLEYGASTSVFFKHVYIDPVAFGEYSKTGTFPEGTVMILELLSKEDKNEPNLTGTIEGEFELLEASVKDSTRFPEDRWAYYSFGNPAKPREKATPFPSSSPNSCWKCHDDKADADHVFMQFYPVLRAAHAQ